MAELPVVSTEATDICQLVETKRVLLEKMRDDFKDKGKMGVWWDGKVSEERKKVWWYLYLFTFKSSDKASVLQEMEKYIQLYKSLENVDSLTFDEIEKLDNELKEAVETAKKQTVLTNSKAVHKVCKDLVSSKIAKKVTRLKNEVGTGEYKTLRENFEAMVSFHIDQCKEEYKSEIQFLKEANEIQSKEKLEMKESFEEKISDIFGRLRLMEHAFQEMEKSNAGNSKSDEESSSSKDNHE